MKQYSKNSKSKSAKYSAYYANCSELPLETFLHICMTGDLTNLRRDGEWEPLTQEHKDLWGDILMEYAELDNNQDILTKFETQKDIIQLQSAYNVINAMILWLQLVTPPEPTSVQYVNDLQKMGYHVDCTNSELYKLSLERAAKKTGSILTMIAMKKNTLKGEQIEEKNISFDAIMALISAELKFVIPEDISVARYCEYKKIMKRRITVENGRIKS